MFGDTRPTNGEERLDSLGCRGGRLMLPDTDHFPAEASEDRVSLRVTLAIHGDLLSPPRGVGFGLDAMLGTPMPKAAINEHGDPGLRENDVDAAPRKSWDRMVDAEAQPVSVKQRTEAQLRHCVPSADAAQLRTDLW